MENRYRTALSNRDIQITDFGKDREGGLWDAVEMSAQLKLVA